MKNCSIFILFIWLNSLGFSQGISGSVTLIDSEEGIPDVKVEIIYFDSVISTVYTDYAGDYRIQNLHLGFYNIRFSQKGFQMQLVRNIGVFPNNISPVSISDFESIIGHTDSIEYVELLENLYNTGEIIGNENLELECFPEIIKPKEIPDYGNLTGIIFDSKTGVSIPMANVVLKRRNEIINGISTDFDGIFQFDSIPIDYYQIEVSFIGYVTKVIYSQFIGSGVKSNLKIALDEADVDKIIIIYHCGPDLFDIDQSSETFDIEDIKNRPF